MDFHVSNHLIMQLLGTLYGEAFELHITVLCLSKFLKQVLQKFSIVFFIGRTINGGFYQPSLCYLNRYKLD